MFKIEWKFVNHSIKNRLTMKHWRFSKNSAAVSLFPFIQPFLGKQSKIEYEWAAIFDGMNFFFFKKKEETANIKFDDYEYSNWSDAYPFRYSIIVFLFGYVFFFLLCTFRLCLQFVLYFLVCCCFSTDETKFSLDLYAIFRWQRPKLWFFCPFGMGYITNFFSLSNVIKRMLVFSLLFLTIVFRCYFHINCVTNIDYGHSKPKLIASIRGKWSSNLWFFIGFFSFSFQSMTARVHTYTNKHLRCHLNSSECKRWQHWLLWSEPKTATMARIVLEIRKHKKNRHSSIRKKNGSHCKYIQDLFSSFLSFSLDAVLSIAIKWL